MTAEQDHGGRVASCPTCSATFEITGFAQDSHVKARNSHAKACARRTPEARAHWHRTGNWPQWGRL